MNYEFLTNPDIFKNSNEIEYKVCRLCVVRGRLVEEHQHGVSHECQGGGDLPLVPAGELPDVRLVLPRQTQQLDAAVHHLGQGGEEERKDEGIRK